MSISPASDATTDEGRDLLIGPFTGRLVGEELGGRYRVERVLGKGGMARVYAGWDKVLERPCALKVASEPKHFGRLAREARIAARLPAAGIAHVYDLGLLTDGHTPFVALERLEGETLADLLRREKRLPAERALRIARDIARVLATLHEKGVIHRDVTPANIFLCASGEVRLLDFGLAHVAGAAPSTEDGKPLGTPGFTSLEQARGAQDLDGRVDVYGLGVCLYRMLAGGEGVNAKVVDNPFNVGPLVASAGVWADVRRYVPALPPAIAKVVNRAVERERERRWPSMHAFRVALDACINTLQPSPSPVVPRRTRLVIGAIIVLALIAAATTIALTFTRPRPHRISPSPPVPTTVPAEAAPAPPQKPISDQIGFEGWIP